MARKSTWKSDRIGELQLLARRWVDAALDHRNSNLAKFRPALTRTIGREMSDVEFRDACAEALAWVIVSSTSHPDDDLEATLRRASVYSPFLVELLGVLRSERGSGLASEMSQPAAVDPAIDSPLCYEHYLAVRDPSTRMERGVFYTPRVVARHIVERIDSALRKHFGLADGLADTATWSDMRRRWPTLQIPRETSGDECFVRVLDPAAGTGVFLIEVVDRIHRTLRDKWQSEGLSEENIVDRWNAYVPLYLIPRIVAIELMPTPSVISQLAVAKKLAETAYDFHASQPLRFSIADTLLEPDCLTSLPLFQKLRRTEPPQDAFTVILGNPPFRGISSNPSSWIGKLLRGIGPDDQPVVSYYEVDGEPLRERKLWLQDDYVKFMRYAQWQIERTGVGVLGFVTNHGYLDNATFRGMRHALLETFQQIDVFDLHGNRKKNKTAPDGGSDEGMFEIEQGVAIGIFSRTVSEAAVCVTHREIWGSRVAKAKAIAEDDRVPRTQILPRPPHYLFVPTEKDGHPEYEAGFSLNDVMPVNSTAVVTARDSFVVGFDEAILSMRLRAFCDESISDDEIRASFFTNSRSTKYPPGDTRGWKLADARKRMMQESNWARFLRPCLYRPFDRRVIFWADWMIDWPRQEVMRHMLARPNLALIARRQMPPTGPCNYFWVSDTIAIDGLIRSDNRGSEAIFPLWLEADTAASKENISSSFVAAVESRLGLSWRGCEKIGTGTSQLREILAKHRHPLEASPIVSQPRSVSGEFPADNAFCPIDVFHYIYALFNASTYRQRYRENLRRDFPRVLIPKYLAVWTAFRDIGERLTEIHLSAPEIVEESSGEMQDCVPLGAGFPKFAAGQIWLAKEGPVVPASERVWDFQVGAHQVCRKWLRDRKAFDARTLQRYRQIVALVAETLALRDSLDETVADAGGWGAVFSA